MTGLDAVALEADLFPEGDRSVLAVVNIGRPLAEPDHPRGPRLGYDDVVATI